MASDTTGMTLTRQQLHDLVWSRSLQSLSAVYDISDVGLAKVCRRFDVPVPPRGYWRRLETGCSPKQAKLPKSSHDPEARVLTLRPRPVDDGADKRLKEAITAVGEIAVPTTLEKAAPLHPLVKKAKARLLSLGSPFDYLQVDEGEYLLDIDVYPESLDRALRIFDTLIKALAVQGFQVRLGPPRSLRGWEQAQHRVARGRASVVEVGEVDIRIGLRERRRKLTPKAVTGRLRSPSLAESHESSGELSLQLFGPDGYFRPDKKFTDGKREHLEAQLAKVVAAIPLLAEQELTQFHDWEAGQERRRQELERHRLWQAARAEVARQRGVIDQQLAAWQRSNELSAFLGAVRDRPADVAAMAAEARVSDQDWLRALEDYIADLAPGRSEEGTSLQPTR